MHLLLISKINFPIQLFSTVRSVIQAARQSVPCGQVHGLGEDWQLKDMEQVGNWKQEMELNKKICSICGKKRNVININAENKLLPSRDIQDIFVS